MNFNLGNNHGSKRLTGFTGKLFALIIIGIMFLAFNVVGKDFELLTEKSVGTVISLEYNYPSRTSSSNNKSTTCYLVVEHVHNNQTIQGRTLSSSTGNCNKTVGSQVEILYNPDNPQNLEIDGLFGGKNIMLIVKIALGVVFILLLSNVLLRIAVMTGLAALIIHSIQKKKK